MKLLTIIILTFMAALPAAMNAQVRFTDKLQQQVEGEGTITLDQDPLLTDILNGDIVVPSNIATTTKVSAITTETKVRQDAEEMHGKVSGMHQKVRGYRVQVYFGGNQRANQTQAQKVGTRVTGMFPELRAYTTFESPHWRCRVGDFITYDDASAYMHKIKAKGIAEAMVVKSEIYVTAEQLKKEQQMK